MSGRGLLVRVWRGRTLDVLLAALLSLYAQLELAYTGHAGPAACSLSLVMTGSLLWRRVAPVPVAVVVVGTFGLQAVALDPAPQVLANALAVLVALYSASSFSGPKAALPVLVLAALSFAAFEADQGEPVNVIGDLAFAAPVWGVGWFVWKRRHELEEQLATAEADVLSADLRADHALAEERRRIARELHDVVSHAVTVVVLQARGGRTMLDRDPAQTRAALDAIELAGQEALAEMRRLVTLLREPSLDTAPQPGLSDLNALVEAARSSGARIELRTSGRVVPLSPGTELTAYRLVQEGLTNALRHAPGTPVQIDVGYGPTSLTLRVQNPSRPATQSTSGGQGLLGMRERVELYEGTLTYGPVGDGWEVVGALPYGGGQSPPLTRPVTAATLSAEPA